MIVAKQVKAARVMLDLTQSDLAWGASLSEAQRRGEPKE